MTTVADALDRIARDVSVTAPSDWSAATGTTHVQLRDDFLPMTCEDIADRIDLGAPIGKQTTITGTGVGEYSLPSDFKRLTEGDWRIYEPQRANRRGVPVQDDGQWTDLETYGTTGVERYYRINGYDGAFTIEFLPVLDTGDTITVSYIANVWCKTTGGTEQAVITGVDDVLLLPRRIVEVGTAYRYLARHGLPYDAQYGEYEALLLRLSATSKSRKTFGGSGRSGGAFRYRYPDPPAVIPSS